MQSGIPIVNFPDVSANAKSPWASALQGALQGYGNMQQLQQQNYDNKIKAAQAQYAPYTQYGQAATSIAQANMLPYQIQSQLYSSPSTWMAMQQLAQTNPEAYKNFASQMANNISRSIPAGGNIFGNIQLPIPGQSTGMGNNISAGNYQPTTPDQQNYLSSLVGNTTQAAPNINGQQANQAQKTQGTPLLPVSQGNAVGGTITAKYNQTPFKPGDLVWDSQNKKIISNAEPAVIQQAQQGLSGLQRIDPLIRRLGIEQFPGQSGWTNLLSDIEAKQNKWGPKALNNFFPQFQTQYPDIAKQFNLSGLALPTLKARAESDIATAPEQLIRIYGLRPGKNTTQELSKIIEPGDGETGDQYTQRLMEKISQMQDEEGAPYKQQLNSGFDVTNSNGTPAQVSNVQTQESNVNTNANVSSKMWPTNKAAINADDPAIEGHMPPPGTRWMVRPDGKQVPVHESRLNEAKNTWFYRDINP